MFLRLKNIFERSLISLIQEHSYCLKLPNLNYLRHYELNDLLVTDYKISQKTQKSPDILSIIKKLSDSDLKFYIEMLLSTLKFENNNHLIRLKKSKLDVTPWTYEIIRDTFCSPLTEEKIKPIIESSQIKYDQFVSDYINVHAKITYQSDEVKSKNVLDLNY